MRTIGFWAGIGAAICLPASAMAQAVHSSARREERDDAIERGHRIRIALLLAFDQIHCGTT